MSEHPNVALVNRMTCAAVEGDRRTLGACFSDDAPFHVRGPLPKAGDHVGVDVRTGVARTRHPAMQTDAGARGRQEQNGGDDRMQHADHDAVIAHGNPGGAKPARKPCWYS